MSEPEVIGERTALTGENLLFHAANHARYWRDMDSEGLEYDPSDSLRQLVLYVGKTLVVRALDEERPHVIEKSRFEPVWYGNDYRYAYVADRKTPRVAEATGRLETVPAFASDIRLRGREQGLIWPRTVYYRFDMFDGNFEPRVSVEVIESAK